MWNYVQVIHLELNVVGLGRWTEDVEILGFVDFSDVVN